MKDGYSASIRTGLRAFGFSTDPLVLMRCFSRQECCSVRCAQL